MGNVTNKGNKGAPVQAFHGDITRSDIIANTANVLEHLVCVSGSVTFKAFHCPEPEHEQKKCGIYVAGKIFANVICKKLSSLLIFATNFTTCPTSSITQFFVDGLRNIPKLECIEFIGCTFSTHVLQALITGLTSRTNFTHLLFRGCYGLTIDTSLSDLLSNCSQVALRTLAIIACDTDADAIKELGKAMAINSNFHSCSFKFAPSDTATPSSDEALISVFKNILPLVENFHLVSFNAHSTSTVSSALVEVLSSTQFPRRFRLDLCPLPHGFPASMYQDILNAISKSNISKLQLSLPKAEVEVGSFDFTLRALIECDHLDSLNLTIYELGNFHTTIPSHTCESIALALGAPSCKLRALSIPTMDESGIVMLLDSLKANKSLQHLNIGSMPHNTSHLFYSTLVDVLTARMADQPTTTTTTTTTTNTTNTTTTTTTTTTKNLTLNSIHPMPVAMHMPMPMPMPVQKEHTGEDESLRELLHRNLVCCLRRSATLVQLCFLTIEHSALLKKKARATLPKDLHNKMYHFIAWKSKRLGERGSIPLAVNFWELVSSLDWCP